MKNKLIPSIPRSSAALLVCLAFSAVVHAEDSAATSSHSRSQTGAAARPEIERQRQEAERQAQGTLDQEAIAAIRDTENAVKAIADGKTDEALRGNRTCHRQDQCSARPQPGHGAAPSRSAGDRD